MQSGTFRAILARVLGRTRTYCVYTSTSAQGAGRPDRCICAYDDANEPPPDLVKWYRCHAGRLAAWLMFRRLYRTGAVLMTFTEHNEIIGYGWLQTWHPLRQEFWWLAGQAICLGPYWTHEAHRGRGIYGRMLSHSLHECTQRRWSKLFIWAELSNTASNRGIQKAGFEYHGCHRVSIYLLGLIRRHRVLTGAHPPGSQPSGRLAVNDDRGVPD